MPIGPAGTCQRGLSDTQNAPTHREQWRTTSTIAMQDNIEATTQHTLILRGGSNNNGHRHICEARGRFLDLANTQAPYIIFSRGKGLNLGWVSIACEPACEPHSVVRLLDFLAHRNSRLPRRILPSKFSSIDVQRERELLACRRALLGTPAYLADRIARRKACAPVHQSNGVGGAARNKLRLVRDNVTVGEAA